MSTFYNRTCKAVSSHNRPSMQRLRDGGSWSLFDPVHVPLLLSTHGPEFTTAYELYEASAPVVDRTTASDIWNLICRAQQESGTPFVMYQDAINGQYCTCLFLYIPLLTNSPIF